MVSEKMVSNQQQLSPKSTKKVTAGRRVVDIKDLVVRVPKVKLPIIKGVSFFSLEGEILGLIGESGAGKTTILRCMTGQMEPYRGSVSVAGIDIVQHKAEAVKRFGYVPQLELVSIYPQFTPIQNIYYFGKMYLSGVPDSQIKERAKELLGILGFTEDLMTKKVKHLSGGEKKRVSIAVGMIHDPDVLLLDEPTTGLDVSLRIQILNYLKNLNKRLGISIVIVSHDLEIAQYCDRIVLLDSGRFIEFGDPEELINSLLPSQGRAIKLEVSELNDEVMETFRSIPEIKFVIKTGRNDMKIFADEVDRTMIGKSIEVCDLMGLDVLSITLDRAEFTSYYRIRARLAKDEVKALDEKEFSK
ncbi:ATP-binding cassette domain-containing protein [Candidatus Bathyarchaeota archaeon]|nr:ATP-binding cassette domain-containing protein [Candidatus Bathyarchaeota archaeon]